MYLLKSTFYAIVFMVFVAVIFFAFFATVDNQSGDRKPQSGDESKNVTKKKVVILYWSKVFGSIPSVNINPERWPYFYAGHNCPITCELTTDKGRAKEASAFVVHARNPGEIPPKTYSHLPWILHTNENPAFTGPLRDPRFMKQFNYLASYRLDSDFPCTAFLKPSLEVPIPFKEKTGLVVAVFSHCEKVRTRYLSELMKHIKVDSYGGCLNNKKDRPKKGATVWHDNMELQRNYKFTIVFPNADCDFYMTEKIYTALSAGSVPIWLGTDGIDEVLKWGNLNHSIIKVKDFSSPKALAEFLTKLSQNEGEYRKYLKWKYEGFQFPKEYYASPIGQWWDGLPLYCRVCMKVAQDPKGHKGLTVDKCDGRQARTFEKWLGKAT